MMRAKCSRDARIQDAQGFQDTPMYVYSEINLTVLSGASSQVLEHRSALFVSLGNTGQAGIPTNILGQV